MTNLSTIDKLVEMRLTALAVAFRNQINDLKYIPFEDRFDMLIQQSKKKRLKRMIRNVGID